MNSPEIAAKDQAIEPMHFAMGCAVVSIALFLATFAIEFLRLR
jgi:hypothetical protein